MQILAPGGDVPFWCLGKQYDAFYTRIADYSVPPLNAGKRTSSRARRTRQSRQVYTMHTSSEQTGARGNQSPAHQLSRYFNHHVHRHAISNAIHIPDRTTPIGSLIDKYLKGNLPLDDHAIHLLFSANRWEAAYDPCPTSRRAVPDISHSERIEREIASGTTLVLDRYHHSGCVYSAAKHVPGLDLDWAHGPEVGLPKPDLCIFLNISAEKAAERRGFGEEKYETAQMQMGVRTLFEQLLKAEGDVAAVIDGGMEPDQVEREVFDAVMNRLKMLKRGELEAELGRVQPLARP